MEDDMMSGGGGQAAAASFDGMIKGWPETSLNMSNVPTEKDKFILYMTCELFKAQHISNPKEQAKHSVEYAHALYNELRSRGLLE